MQKLHWLALLCLGGIPLLRGAEPANRIVERGPHHRTWERTIEESQPDGRKVTRTTRTVELASGLHYFDGAEWHETRELIEPHHNGAVAHRGPHKAAFAANLNTFGAIQLVDVNGQRFTSHVLGLAYTDAATGQSVLIAELKNCQGEIIPPNQIVYRDAFAGLRADVRYTYMRDGFEQDIILREAPAGSPADYGLNPETTRLEVFTEFVEAPAGLATTEFLKIEQDPQKRMRMVDFVDETLHFGALKIGKGRAFDLQGKLRGDLPVGKTWEVLEGRTFLIEAVEFEAVAPALNELPAANQARAVGQPAKGAPALLAMLKPQAKPRAPVAQALPRRDTDIADARASRLLAATPAAAQNAAQHSLLRPFPAAPKARAAAVNKPMKQLAALDLSRGVLLDYVVTTTGGLTDFTFRPEATHSVSGTVNLYGTTTIAGGTIVKYARGASLNVSGTIVCDTTPYHPAVFTAADDTSVGDFVSGSSLTGYYATAALRASSNVVGELHNLRFAYAATAIDWAGSQERFYNLQFINCSNAVRRVNATNAPLHNVLVSNAVYVVTGSNSTFHAQHLTANRVGTLANLTGTPAAVTVTNSILLNVTNAGTGTLSWNYVATNGMGGVSAPANAWPVSLSDFTGVVGGSHYLATNSSLIDAGTTSIAPALLNEIRSLTTLAPTLLNSTSHVSFTVGPTATRDNDTPDLGYHYAPLDVIVRNHRLNTNVTLTLTNGAAIGVDYNGSSWGLIFDTATLTSIGTLTNLNRIVRAHNVQERSTGNPGTRSMFYDLGNDNQSHGNSKVRLRFTEMAALAADGYTVFTGKHFSEWEWSHSWIYNCSVLITADKGGQKIGFTNNVFQWADCALQRGSTTSEFHLRNNLFQRHNLNVAQGNSTWTIRDNLFDSGIVYAPGATITHSHNAFYNVTSSLSGGTNNQVLGSLSYQSDPYGRYGPLGRFYQPAGSPLLNAGSQTANLAGLYHFTTTTNQVKETNSLVDIGFHQVALNNTGHPADSDTDGLADYFEDLNGNGTADAGELNCNNSDTDGDGTGDGAELLQGRNPLGGALANPAGLNLNVFTPLK
jgi:hypothetical protein